MIPGGDSDLVTGPSAATHPAVRALVDPMSVASAARRLQGLLPPVCRPVPPAGWTGPAAAAAGALLTETFAAYDAIRRAIGEVADALAVTASALADAAALQSAGNRLWAVCGLGSGAVGAGVDPATAADRAAAVTVDRLWADAAAQLAEADDRCAARLHAIRTAQAAVLAPLVPPVSPEQVALALLQVGGWGSVPTGLVGPLGAVLADPALPERLDSAE